MNKRLIRLLPYKLGSHSADALASELGILKIIPGPESKFIGTNKHIVINWGHSQMVPLTKHGHSLKILNHPSRVQKSINKLTSLQILFNNGVSVPKFADNIKAASLMFQDGKTKRVFCRLTLTGSGGDGIHIARKPEELKQCNLYCEGIPKAQEYRIHVLRNSIVDVQEKKAKNGASKDADWNAEIRNLQFGWVFVRDGVNAPKTALQEAIKAVAALRLDFGAVDLAIDKRTGKPVVFEVNTSPGLEGSTITNYANAFNELLIKEQQGM